MSSWRQWWGLVTNRTLLKGTFHLAKPEANGVFDSGD
jgi:hypothetical protein